MSHLLLAAREALDEQGGETVVMVGAIGLDVPVILVEAESDLDLGRGAHLGVAHQRLVVPRVAAIAVVVDFGGAWVEDDAVQRDTPGRHHPAGRAAGERLGVGGDFEPILLLRDGVGVAAVREGRDLVVWDTIGLDDALVALDGEGDLILAGRLGVGFLEGRALGGVGGYQGGDSEEEREEGAAHWDRQVLPRKWPKVTAKTDLGLAFPAKQFSFAPWLPPPNSSPVPSPA